MRNLSKPILLNLSLRQLEQEQENTLASIRYARRIQDAILIDRAVLKEIFDDFAIVYEPKDIVSGDFYYAKEKGNKKFLFVGDCTGHGVPAAFLSILCNDILIRSMKKLDCPQLILERVNKLLTERLNHDTDELCDGMDCSLATIDYASNMVYFSGACNNGLLIKQNGDAILLEGTRRSIGNCCFNERKPDFALRSETFEKGDMLYLYTDGYRDQFNNKGMKFGKSRFIKTLSDIRTKSLSAQQDTLVSLFNKYKSGTFQIDDVLVLGIRL